MEPVETDAAAKMFEATSSFGIVPTFWLLLFIVSYLYTILFAGVPPQGASTSREPEDLPEGSRGDMSTSTAADAAVLDALYGDLPPYRPELAEGTEVEGAVSYTHLTLPTKRIV